MSAIVVGSTGIIGRAIVEALLKDESISTVYTLSRKTTSHQHPKIRHAFLDLRADAHSMAAGLYGVSVEYIYFCAYTSLSDPSETFNVNKAMLTNFLGALEKVDAIKDVKRFILTCGLKQYGVHLGQSKQPMVETDPILVNDLGGIEWPANFYYDQQKTLAESALKHNFEWICTLPKDVIGYARGNFMNQATALGLYCTVNRALPGATLPFPGNRDNFFSFNTWTSADLHAKFCLWAATAPGVGNQIFNVVNGDTESWQSIWPQLAQRFNCTIPDALFSSTWDCSGVSKVRLKTLQPIAAHAEQMGLKSDPVVYEPATLDLRLDLEAWSRCPDVLEAWRTIRDQCDLDQSAWDNATWGFMAMAFGRKFSTVASMSKARRFGWTGYEDTWEAFDRTFAILEKEKILPSS